MTYQSRCEPRFMKSKPRWSFLPLSCVIYMKAKHEKNSNVISFPPFILNGPVITFIASVSLRNLQRVCGLVHVIEVLYSTWKCPARVEMLVIIKHAFPI